MAYLIGAVFGGVFITILVGLLLGLAFKSKEPTERAAFAAVFAWIISSVLAGFGMSNGRDFRFEVSLYYLPGAIVAFFYLRLRYGKMWSDDEEFE